MNTAPVLDVVDLQVHFNTARGRIEAVRGISFTLGRERLGIVGESGSGKSQTGRALLGLTAANGVVSARRVCFQGADLLGLSKTAWRRFRGARISMIMQDPKFSLNPVMTVGRQIMEASRRHHRTHRKQAYRRSIDMLARVKIREPERVMNQYPHQLSGGMGQRVMIAMMLMPEPELLIADEPTSALDVTVQFEVLSILDELVRNRGMALMLISHDLKLVASFCDRILVMYQGLIVERLDSADLGQARHPYTRGLLNCLPTPDRQGRELPVLERDPAWAVPVQPV